VCGFFYFDSKSIYKIASVAQNPLVLIDGLDRYGRDGIYLSLLYDLLSILICRVVSRFVWKCRDLIYLTQDNQWISCIWPRFLPYIFFNWCALSVSFLMVFLYGWCLLEYISAYNLSTAFNYFQPKIRIILIILFGR